MNKYKDNNTSLLKLILWLDRNLYIDFMIAKKLVFEKYISTSYLDLEFDYEVDTF